MARLPQASCAATWIMLLAGGPTTARAQDATVPEDIRRYTESFEEAVRAYDVDAWTELVADDVVMMAPNGRMVEGRTAFHDLWSRTFAGQTGPNPLRVILHEARVADDLAVVRAGYGPEGADAVGQYVWILERAGADQPWVLAWWIFNRVAQG